MTKQAVSNLQDELRSARAANDAAMREIKQLRDEVNGFASKSQATSAKQPVQKILIMQTIATGFGFGIGLMLAGLIAWLFVALIGFAIVGSGPTAQPPRAATPAVVPEWKDA